VHALSQLCSYLLIFSVLFLPLLLQTYDVLILFAVYFLYVYARPYKATFVNILELALLAYLGLFLILAKDFQQQAATSTQLDATSVDSCGKAVPTISTEWIVFGVLSFLPVTVLLLLVGKWLCSRWFQILRYVCIIIEGMQNFISYIIYILLKISNYTKLYIIYTYIILYMHVSHVAPIRNRLCTRGGGVKGLLQPGPPSHIHSTTTGRNVTEATIELLQCKSSDTEF